MLLNITKKKNKNITELFSNYYEKFLDLKTNYISDLKEYNTRELIKGIRIIEHFLYKLPILNKVLFSFIKDDFVFTLKKYKNKYLFICMLPSNQLSTNIMNFDETDVYDKYCDLNIFLSKDYYYYSTNILDINSRTWVSKETELLKIDNNLIKVKEEAINIYYQFLPEILFALKY